MPKLSIPKTLSICGLSAIAAISNTAPAWLAAIATATTGHTSPEAVLGGTLLLGAVNSAVNAYVGKHVSNEEAPGSANFRNIENEDLEKCSFDALLKALILVVKNLPDYRDAQLDEYAPKRQQIQDKASEIEAYFQELLRQLKQGQLSLSKFELNPAHGSDIFQAIQAGKVGKDLLTKNQTSDTLTNYSISVFPESFRKGAYFDWIDDMLRNGFNWNGEQTHWFEFYCHALIANLKPDNDEKKPAYCTRAHAFLQGKGLATVVLQQEQQSIKLDQLIKWTTERENSFDQLRQWLEDFARPTPPQPLLQVLEQHYTQERETHYRRRWTPMLGREEAVQQLDEFLEYPNPFCWWAITGPGGMGKSRLALDFCLKHGQMHTNEPPQWEAGFVQTSQIEGQRPFDWAHWIPDRPHLLVIDYVAGRVQTVQRIISDLTVVSRQLPHKVRLLVLERGVNQPWWQELTGRTEVKEMLYQSSIDASSKSTLNLPSLTTNARWAVVQQVQQRMDKPSLPDADKAKTLADIDRIDPANRPLFVLLTALAIANGATIDTWHQSELLDYHLKLDEMEWRKKEKDEICLRKHKNLLALATITGGLTEDDLLNLNKDWKFIPSIDDGEFKPALYALMADVRGNGQTEYAPLEPDPYGEYFLLEWIKNCKTQNNLADRKTPDRFVEWAWAKKSDKILSTAYHAFQNYFGHEYLSTLYPPPPAGSDETTAENRARLVVGFTYLTNEISPETCLQLYNQIRNSESVLAHAAIQLELVKSAYNLITGLSKEESWRDTANQQFEWLKKTFGQATSEAIQLELVKSAYNLITGLSKEESWRDTANQQFEWLKKTFENSPSEAIQLQLVTSATNLLGGLSEEESWRDTANQQFEWLETFTNEHQTDAICISFAMAAYNLMSPCVSRKEWNHIETFFERLTSVISGLSFSPDLLFEFADCLQLTLSNPQWVVILEESITKPEQSPFWERIQQLSYWIQEFKDEERWKILAAKVGSNEPLMALIQRYGEVMEENNDSGEPDKAS
jgi:hypothetical protein